MTSAHYKNFFGRQRSIQPVGKVEQWIGLALCIAMLAVGIFEQLVLNRSTSSDSFSPDWFLYATVGFFMAGIIQWNDRYQWSRIQTTIWWIGLLLLLWVANGLPFDLLRLTPLLPQRVDWPVLATKTLALTAALMLARILLVRHAVPVSNRYGYVAFVLAMPYPFLRTWWALGGTLGLMWPGAAGHGFLPWLASIPWLLAALLSLLLVSNWKWMSRRILVPAGWFATIVVATIAPAACWSLITKLMEGADFEFLGMATWIPCLLYGSWFFWAIAIGAATRVYQLRTFKSEGVTKGTRL